MQHQRVDPRDVCRSKPEKLRAVLGEDADNVLGACTNLVDRVRHSFDAECNKRSSRHVSQGQKKGRKQTKAFWSQFNKLLSELPEMPAPEAARSTQWDPDGPRKVRVPSDISGCTCEELESSPAHINKGCRGLEMFNVSPRTVYQTPTGAVIALLHAGKSALFGELQVRVQVFEEQV